jgi:predicted DNA-binding antitoxin AbrB/MazE fold protein
MQKTLEAIYTGGVLRPVETLQGLRENQRVVVTVTAPTEQNPFADWVGGMPDEDAARMIQVIDAEFESVDPNEWK